MKNIINWIKEHLWFLLLGSSVFVLFIGACLLILFKVDDIVARNLLLGYAVITVGLGVAIVWFNAITKKD